MDSGINQQDIDFESPSKSLNNECVSTPESMDQDNSIFVFSGNAETPIVQELSTTLLNLKWGFRKREESLKQQLTDHKNALIMLHSAHDKLRKKLRDMCSKMCNQMELSETYASLRVEQSSLLESRELQVKDLYQRLNRKELSTPPPESNDIENDADPGLAPEDMLDDFYEEFDSEKSQSQHSIEKSSLEDGNVSPKANDKRETKLLSPSNKTNRLDVESKAATTPRTKSPKTTAEIGVLCTAEALREALSDSDLESSFGIELEAKNGIPIERDPMADSGNFDLIAELAIKSPSPTTAEKFIARIHEEDLLKEASEEELRDNLDDELIRDIWETQIVLGETLNTIEEYKQSVLQSKDKDQDKDTSDDNSLQLQLAQERIIELEDIKDSLETKLKEAKNSYNTQNQVKWKMIHDLEENNVKLTSTIHSLSVLVEEQQIQLDKSSSKCKVERSCQTESYSSQQQGFSSSANGGFSLGDDALTRLLFSPSSPIRGTTRSEELLFQQISDRANERKPRATGNNRGGDLSAVEASLLNGTGNGLEGYSEETKNGAQAMPLSSLSSADDGDDGVTQTDYEEFLRREIKAMEEELNQLSLISPNKTNSSKVEAKSSPSKSKHDDEGDFEAVKLHWDNQLLSKEKADLQRENVYLQRELDLYRTKIFTVVSNEGSMINGMPELNISFRAGSAFEYLTPSGSSSQVLYILDQLVGNNNDLVDKVQTLETQNQSLANKAVDTEAKLAETTRQFEEKKALNEKMRSLLSQASMTMTATEEDYRQLQEQVKSLTESLKTSTQENRRLSLAVSKLEKNQKLLQREKSVLSTTSARVAFPIRR